MLFTDEICEDKTIIIVIGNVSFGSFSTNMMKDGEHCFPDLSGWGCLLPDLSRWGVFAHVEGNSNQSQHHHRHLL